MTDSTSDKVLSIIKNIKDTPASNETIEENILPKVKSKPKQPVTRGKLKSGKFWKSSRERFSSINKTKGLKQDFQKKTALRMELKRIKDLSKEMQEQMNQKELERKERRRENIKRNEENSRKAEVVQVITNTAKIKRMRKKQLRFIQKRDTNKEIETSA